MCLDRQWHTDEISGAIVLIVMALQFDPGEHLVTRLQLSYTKIVMLQVYKTGVIILVFE